MFLFDMFTKVKKLFALLTVGCSLGACLETESKTNQVHHIDIPIDAMEAMNAASSSDLKEEKPAPPWRFWRPWKFWQWGQSLLKEGFSSSADSMQSASRFHTRNSRLVHGQVY